MMATQAHVRPIQLQGNAQRVGRAEHIARVVLVQLLQTSLVFSYVIKLTLHVRSVCFRSSFIHSLNCMPELALTV